MTEDNLRENKKNYKVYIHKNKINNKVYIGITKNSCFQRWNNGRGYKGCTAFENAIKKYGWNGFDHNILFENLTKEEARKKEISLIVHYNSTNSEYGYNSSPGGNVMSDQTKLKISLKNSGINNGMYGKRHTSETKQKIAEASKRMWGEEKRHNVLSKRMQGKNNPNYGKKHTSEEIEFLRKIRLGKPAPNRKKVICIDTGEIFDSIRSAETQTGISNISYCCNGKRQSCGGLHWRFYE